MVAYSIGMPYTVVGVGRWLWFGSVVPILAQSPTMVVQKEGYFPLLVCSTTIYIPSIG
jgi:hypothetical protein